MNFNDYTFGLCIPPQHGVEEAERGLRQQGGGEGAQAPRQVPQLLQGAYLRTDNHNTMQVPALVVPNLQKGAVLRIRDILVWIRIRGISSSD